MNLTDGNAFGFNKVFWKATLLIRKFKKKKNQTRKCWKG